MSAKQHNHKEESQRLAARVAQAEAKERRRIAEGLHEQVGQLLAVAKLRLVAGQQQSGAPRQLLEEIGQHLDQAIWATRALTFELGSPVLYELGLEEAIRSLGLQIAQTHSLRVRVDAGAEPAPLTDDVRDVLFRVARELLMNVVKHAGAHDVEVSVDRVGTNLRLTVRDDGVGFDASPAALNAADGVGLVSLDAQLAHAGGHLEIDSTPGAGTRAVAVAPLKGGCGAS